MKQAHKKTDAGENRLMFENFIPCKFKVLVTRMLGILNRSYENLDITGPEFSIMITLAEHKDLSTRDINRITVMDKATITRALDRLADKKLISRSKDKVDKRLNNIRLTNKGMAIFSEIEKSALAYEKMFLKNINVTELNTLLAIFEKLDHNINELD